MASSEARLADEMLDAQDRIAVLQLLTLSPTERLQYLLDELAFDDAVGPPPSG